MKVVAIARVAVHVAANISNFATANFVALFPRGGLIKPLS